ncbi:hypothetical protein AMS68_006311 [Peltaster fructicola]|uniref:Isopropylmalate dehydrogenase-like domain-containing protein n=1 Tax=Peltaster fructicola TaxID=286661 RepID=A0A6H0Y1B3_9PEZI|nr:hypothetical protein AMS68_006311 [Peltaster fructicola]
MSRTLYKIASIPGDGIGVDITDAAEQVLHKLAELDGGFRFEFTTFDWSSKAYNERGWYMPPDWADQLRKHDAIYFGAVGWPDVPDHISLWNMILPIRNALSQYVNVRPTRILPGVQSPLAQCQKSSKDLDWVIVRENSEGEYAGQEQCSTPWHGAVGQGLYEVAKEYDGVVEYDKMLVDAMTVRMVNRPESLDTIVATNLHADILTDLAAALAGSIGIAPSSNLDPTRENPSMFEPIHGSAPDIAGKGIANPVGAFWSAAEMVKWIGDGKLDHAAAALMSAIEKTTGDGLTTRDLGGSKGTKEVTDAVCKELETALKKT